MTNFPISRLKPLHATLGMGALGKPFIDVEFASFFVPDPHSFSDEGLIFDTVLHAEQVTLPTLELCKLQNQVFEFPANPTDGYIDASVYFTDTHNPVDITRITFGRFEGDRIEATVVSRWIMTFENTGFDDFVYIFSVPMIAKQ